MQPGSTGHPGDKGNFADGILEALLDTDDPLLRYVSLTRAQETYEALINRIAAERARAVAEMHSTGLSYARIAETIGFTRARAQQLVERAGPFQPKTPLRKTEPMDKKSALTAFLELFTSEWPKAAEFATEMWVHPPFRPQPSPMTERHGPAEIATALFAATAFRTLQLGKILNTPDEKYLTAAVEALALLYGGDKTLLIEALKLAVRMQQKDARERAAVAAFVVAAGGALLAAASKG